MEAKLEIRRILKRKKPVFSKQDAHKKKKLSPSWRKPRGHQSKMRLNKKGYRRSVSNGWKSPSEVRGFTPQGFEKIRVGNVKDLEMINPKTQAAEIIATVGLFKRKSIVEEAIKKGITIINFKDPQAVIEAKTKAMTAKKEAKEQQAKHREVKRAKKAEDKKDKSKTENPVKDEKQKKVEEKKEKDKVLTQKS